MPKVQALFVRIPTVAAPRGTMGRVADQTTLVAMGAFDGSFEDGLRIGARLDAIARSTGTPQFKSDR